MLYDVVMVSAIQKRKSAVILQETGRFVDTETECRTPWEAGGRVWVMHRQANDGQGLPATSKAGKNQRSFFPGFFRRRIASVIP